MFLCPQLKVCFVHSLVIVFARVTSGEFFLLESSGVSTLGARGALPHQIQMALWCRKLNTSVLCGKIYLILFNMQSSDSIVNVCVNKLDSQAL